MKKLLIPALALIAGTSFAELKVGTVEMLTLVRNHPNYESNKALLTSTEKDYQKKIDAMKGDLEKIQEEGKKLADQARNPMFKAEAKAKLEKDLGEIQSRFIAGQQRMRAEMMRSQQDLQDLEGRLLKTTTADLRKRVKKFAESHGYDLVIDSSAAIYAKDAFNVTDEVLRAMGVDPATARSATDEKPAKDAAK